MNAIDQALSTFRQPPHHYNCAQTICAAFGRRDLLETMQGCGAGRAPEGTCGALYAAMQIAPGLAESLHRSFGELNGATRCRELKGEKRVPCETCVRTAAGLLVQAGLDGAMKD